jgi:transcription elongation GreA/GreB family factor
LRENHEYKAAKEMQKILMRRKGELENQLVRARGTDFANPRTDVVSMGTIVQSVDLQTNATESFTILGAWDSDPDHGIGPQPEEHHRGVGGLRARGHAGQG